MLKKLLLFCLFTNLNFAYSDNQKISLLFLAVQAQNHKLIKDLLTKVDVDATIDDTENGIKNMTCLHLAVSLADEPTVELLLENNASLEKVMIFQEQEYNVRDFSKYCLDLIESMLIDLAHKKDKLEQSNDAKAKEELVLIRDNYDRFLKIKSHYEAINRLIQKQCKKFNN